jgi:hypothetical protein
MGHFPWNCYACQYQINRLLKNLFDGFWSAAKQSVSQIHLVVSETIKTWHGSYLPNYRKKARTGHAGTGF